MHTFEGWEHLTVAGRTGSEKTGDAEFFSYTTAVPATEIVEQAVQAFGLDGYRLLRLAYASLKIENRPNPKGKPRKMKADEALGLQVLRMQHHLEDGKTATEAITAAKADTLRAMNEAETTVVVTKITKAESDEVDALEKETLKRLAPPVQEP